MSRDDLCEDCGIDTAPKGGLWETYMVHDRLWDEYGAGEGMLCVGCMERRLGRLLAPEDFTEAPINRVRPWYTPRLNSRLAEKR